MPISTSVDRAAVIASYRRVRDLTVDLCATLEPEDMVIQSMDDASPTRWHLAHSTWFFETFVLARGPGDWSPVHPAFEHLFNSYYQSVGEPFPRPRRGLLSRPTVAEVFGYRARVDEAIGALLEEVDGEDLESAARAIEIGLHHERQHQELMLTDIKHAFAQNPLLPAYRPDVDAPRSEAAALPATWVTFDGGVHEVGFGGGGFSFDNETPRHRVFLESFELADRPVTNGEYLRFVEDRGYSRPELWLSAGWDRVLSERWREPIYWRRASDGWKEFTLRGLEPLDPAVPVSHVSYFEADAFARWAGARLPTEAEWEVVASAEPVAGNFVESGLFHPRPTTSAGDASAGRDRRVRGLYGDTWEWTSSAYAPYPGYAPLEGSLGEYNGKFMCGQYVLRGGSCATSGDHIRPTYRNFFSPDARWQLSGVRLARSGGAAA